MEFEELLAFAAIGFAAYLVLRSRSASSSEGGGGDVLITLTGYWPYSATESERTMEGGVVGAARWNGEHVKQLPLYTLEQHKADPEAFPWVSLSGDPTVWMYSQRIDIAALGVRSDGETVTGRVHDTGSHFTGATKVIRHPGYEPIDVCVDNSKSLSSIGASGPTIGLVVEGDVLGDV